MSRRVGERSKISRFFFPLSRSIFVLFFSLGGSSRGIVVAERGHGSAKCAFGLLWGHFVWALAVCAKSPNTQFGGPRREVAVTIRRGDPQREKKRTEMERERGKKKARGPAEGGPDEEGRGAVGAVEGKSRRGGVQGRRGPGHDFFFLFPLCLVFLISIAWRFLVTFQIKKNRVISMSLWGLLFLFFSPFFLFSFFCFFFFRDALGEGREGFVENWKKCNNNNNN